MKYYYEVKFTKPGLAKMCTQCGCIVVNAISDGMKQAEYNVKDLFYQKGALMVQIVELYALPADTIM